MDSGHSWSFSSINSVVPRSRSPLPQAVSDAERRTGEPGVALLAGVRGENSPHYIQRLRKGEKAKAGSNISCPQTNDSWEVLTGNRSADSTAGLKSRLLLKVVSIHFRIAFRSKGTADQMSSELLPWFPRRQREVTDGACYYLVQIGRLLSRLRPNSVAAAHGKDCL
jgi:hypothetical protein